jgi:hypothetical protein
MSGPDNALERTDTIETLLETGGTFRPHQGTT